MSLHFNITWLYGPRVMDRHATKDLKMGPHVYRQLSVIRLCLKVN